MGKSAASKEQMMMREKDMPMQRKQMMMKAKDGFPAMPMKYKFADDLGYFTKAKKPGTSRRGK